jgi:hypothetical protein
MGEHRRTADGRRVFGTDFKRTAVRERRGVAGCRERLGPAQWPVRRLQHPGAALGAGDAEPGQLPSRAPHTKLLPVSR